MATSLPPVIIVANHLLGGEPVPRALVFSLPGLLASLPIILLPLALAPSISLVTFFSLVFSVNRRLRHHIPWVGSRGLEQPRLNRFLTNCFSRFSLQTFTCNDVGRVIFPVPMLFLRRWSSSPLRVNLAAANHFFSQCHLPGISHSFCAMHPPSLPVIFLVYAHNG